MSRPNSLQRGDRHKITNPELLCCHGGPPARTEHKSVLSLTWTIGATKKKSAARTSSTPLHGDGDGGTPAEEEDIPRLGKLMGDND